MGESEQTIYTHTHPPTQASFFSHLYLSFLKELGEVIYLERERKIGHSNKDLDNIPYIPQTKFSYSIKREQAF